MTMLTPDFSPCPQTPASNEVSDPITELLRGHARELIAVALETEVQLVLSQLRGDGRDVVRNGYLPARHVTTAVGDVKVDVPRIRSRDGESVNFASSMIPRYLRRSQSISAWAAYAYLKGISERDVASVLEVVLGEGAKKLTPSVLSELKKSWTKEFDEWNQRDLSNVRFTYLFADGIYQEIRGDNPKICVLVLMGVDERGKKHLIAIEDGTRESTQSWREVLLGAKARGLAAAKLATGDGALGFWAALDEVFPSTTHQRCWMHKTANVLNYLPRTTRAKAKDDLHQIWMAGGRAAAEQAMALFEEKYSAKYPRAVTCLLKDRTALLAFYDFPAEHWLHIRTSNMIESTFATLRHRTKRVKGAFSKDSALAMMLQLALEAQKRWHQITAVERLGELIEGVRFVDGVAQLGVAA
ncbi:MAG: putative transposase, mutator type [Acidimicrobiaceae bacterium]|nr:putative transposase, mutator type [Acidimicrobiaceae bacterium]